MSDFPILGIRINTYTPKQLHTTIQSFITSNSYHWLATINAEMLVHAYDDPEYAHLLNTSDCNCIDGSGPEYIARWLLKQNNIRRIPGVDMIDDIIRLAAQTQQRVLFLGGRERINSQLASEVVAAAYQHTYPHLQILALEGGELTTDKHRQPQLDTKILKQIHEFAPNIILLAGSNPQQEQIVSQLGRMIPSARFGVGIGGAFNMKAGILPRAPQLFRSLGLEWLWRLILQPQRIHRIYKATVVFPFRVLYHQIIPRLRPNVAMCVYDKEGNILLAQRLHDPQHWQFPQGGIEPGHTKLETVYKELQEEVGISQADIDTVLFCNKQHSYVWPNSNTITYQNGFDGQKQSLALVSYHGNPHLTVDKREFSNYKWVPKNKLLEEIHPIRHNLAKIALAQLPF